MSTKLKSIRLFLSLIAVLALVAAVACAAEDEEEEPAPQPETKAVAPAETAPTAAPAAKETMKETPKEAPAETMGEPALAKVGVNGNVTFRYDGPIPTKFNEAPIVAELVKKGELPPVEERLPEDPLVIPPPEAIGVYGGTWRRVYTWAGDHAITYTDSLLWADSDGSAWLPHMAKSVEMSNDNKTMTIKLRKGHKWSDGTPFTTADFQWGWDNIANNEEISPVFDANWVSPVTRNKPKFEVVDDTTVTYTWDDPYGVAPVMLLRGSFLHVNFRWPWWGPSHYMKQFHACCVDKAELDKMVADAGVDNWVELLKLKKNAYQNPELPGLAAWKTSDPSEGEEWILERNPYYPAIDTAGNQLPYIDRIHLTLVEDLETAGLRAANGDIDFQGRHMTLAKLPLYLKEKDRTNIEAQLYNSPSPSDTTININQSYNQDPVIGDLLRTRDFRIALSLGIDRNEINETFFLGRGTPRAYIPEKGTMFYPGDDYHDKYSTFDPDEANRLLDGIGLEKNADGRRIRSDGEPLRLHFVTLGAYAVDYAPVAEIICRTWDKHLGIACDYTTTRDAARMIQNNEEYLFVWESGAGVIPWVGTWNFCPCFQHFRSAVEPGRYYQTGGESGEPSTDPKYANPEGEFPIKRLQDIFDEGKQYPFGHPKQIELGQEGYKIHVDEMINIGVVGSSPLMKGTFLKKTNMKNVPANSLMQGYFNAVPARAEVYFFEDGKNDAGY